MANSHMKGQLANIFDRAQLSHQSQAKVKTWMGLWCKKNSAADLSADQLCLASMLADCGLDPDEWKRFAKACMQFARRYPEKVGIDKLAQDTLKHAGGLALGTAVGPVVAASATGGTAVAGVGLVLATQGTGLATAGMCTGGALALSAPVVGFAAAVVALEKSFQWATADSRKDFGSSWPSHRCATCGTSIHNRGCPHCECRLCEACFEIHYCATAVGTAGITAKATVSKEAAADADDAIITEFLSTLAREVWIGDNEELDEKSAKELEAAYRFELTDTPIESRLLTSPLPICP